MTSRPPDLRGFASPQTCWVKIGLPLQGSGQLGLCPAVIDKADNASEPCQTISG